MNTHLERSEHVAKAFEAGRNSGPYIAYYPTTLELLKGAMTSGELPLSCEHKLIILLTNPNDSERDLEAFKGASEAARLKTIVERLAAQRKGVGVVNSRLMYDYLLDDDMTFEQRRNASIHFLTEGLTKTIIDQEIRRGDKNPGGIVVMVDEELNREVYIDPDIILGEWVAINMSALPLEYVVGLEPVGQEEYDYLAYLQTSIEDIAQERKMLSDARGKISRLS